MSRPPRQSVFDRSGVGAVSDLDGPQWQERFAKLAMEQERFIPRETASNG